MMKHCWISSMTYSQQFLKYSKCISMLYKKKRGCLRNIVRWWGGYWKEVHLMIQRKLKIWWMRIRRIWDIRAECLLLIIRGIINKSNHLDTYTLYLFLLIRIYLYLYLLLSLPLYLYLPLYLIQEYMYVYITKYLITI